MAPVADIAAFAHRAGADAWSRAVSAGRWVAANRPGEAIAVVAIAVCVALGRDDIVSFAGAVLLVAPPYIAAFWLIRVHWALRDRIDALYRHLDDNDAPPTGRHAR